MTNATTALQPFAYLSLRTQFLIASAQARLQALSVSGYFAMRRLPAGLLLFPAISTATQAPFPGDAIASINLSVFSEHDTLVQVVNSFLGTTMPIANVLALLALGRGGALLVDTGGTPIALLDWNSPLDPLSVEILDPNAPAAPDPVLSTTIAGGQYGQDTSCTDILYPGVLVSGTTLIAEACYRRLITTKGSLEYNPLYGYNVTELLQHGMTPEDVAAVPANIRAELLQDERLDDVTVDAVFDPNGAKGPELDITVSARASNGDAFTLVLNVSGVTVQLVSITQ